MTPEQAIDSVQYGKPGRKSASAYFLALHKIAADAQGSESPQYLAAAPDDVVSIGSQLVGMLLKIKKGQDIYEKTVRLSMHPDGYSLHCHTEPAVESILKRLQELAPGRVVVPEMGECPPASDEKEALGYLISYMRQALELARNFRDALGDDALRYKIEELMPKLQETIDDATAYLRQGKSEKTASLKKESISSKRIIEMARSGARKRGLPLTGEQWDRLRSAARQYGSTRAGSQDPRKSLNRGIAMGSLQKSIGDIKAMQDTNKRGLDAALRDPRTIAPAVNAALLGLAGSAAGTYAARASQEQRHRKAENALKNKESALSPGVESGVERTSNLVYPASTATLGGAVGSAFNKRRPSKGALIGALLGGSVGGAGSIASHAAYKDKERRIQELQQEKNKKSSFPEGANPTVVESVEQQRSDSQAANELGFMRKRMEALLQNLESSQAKNESLHQMVEQAQIQAHRSDEQAELAEQQAVDADTRAAEHAQDKMRLMQRIQQTRQVLAQLASEDPVSEEVGAQGLAEGPSSPEMGQPRPLSQAVGAGQQSQQGQGQQPQQPQQQQQNQPPAPKPMPIGGAGSQNPQGKQPAVPSPSPPSATQS